MKSKYILIKLIYIQYYFYHILKHICDKKERKKNIYNFNRDKICNLIQEIRVTWNACDISHITVPEKIILLILIIRESTLENHSFHVNLLPFTSVP